jgi:hypothetical protein
MHAVESRVYAAKKKDKRGVALQQQHSLLSQASWGRLEMKPKKDEKTGRHIKGQKEHKTKRGHGSGTLIANLQALLSIAKSLGIFHSLRSLLTDSSQVV